MFKKQLPLIILISFGIILRFANLFWGQPYWFHPDERNIAAAVTRLQWPTDMNPKFFAYGSFPIYLNFFISTKILETFSLSSDPFFMAIKIGRTISALLSVVMIPLIYFIVYRFFTPRYANKTSFSLKSPAFISALITTFSFGFIQFAHFGTFEIC